MNFLVDKKKNCCGCSACMNICPKNAITMKEDKLGFVYPDIDDTLCVECKLCKKVCAFQHINESNSPLKVYAASRKDKDLIMKSASGGIFAVLAESVIADDGVVFGCSMEYGNDHFSPEHIMIDCYEDLIKLQGSKYVQSKIGNTYNHVKKNLLSGKKVLFSGTPCQVAGLKSFLGKDYDNLFTVDIICHGVPSSAFFNAYIEYQEKKKKIKITEFKFRDKESGWGLNVFMKFINNKGIEKNIRFPSYKSSYFLMFLDAQIYRESCYNCKYTCSHRPADITLGDFWGIAKEHPEALSSNGGNLDMQTGISAVILNTEKGILFFKNIKEKCDMYLSSFEKAEKYNPQLRTPSKKGIMYDSIMKCFYEGGYDSVEKYYRPFLIKKNVKQTVKKIINRKHK